MEKRNAWVGQVRTASTVLTALLFVAAVPLFGRVMGAMKQAIQPRAQVAPIVGTSWSVVKSQDGVLLVTTMRAFRNGRHTASVQAD